MRVFESGISLSASTSTIVYTCILEKNYNFLYIFNLGLFYHMLEDIMIIINAIIIF